ncbi:hypothetical protein [Bosea sp. TND4EK4]|uniref:hypothetical protein n=1 Tax=Bosea sp. TND4EK4 TaxID=1907408 RepID=UPI00095491B8|nr:hypothetical protein [Bosea sp. TND4EK4]SIQ36637.1 hypothetical protein SAMN05880592_102540 [Bosea sp. TND4EK4]
MTSSNMGGDTALPDDEELRLYQRAYLAQQQADTLYLRWEACMAHAVLLEQNPGKIYHDHAGLNGRQLGEGARAAARRFALLLAEPPAFAEEILALKIAVYEAMARDDDEMRRSRAAPMIEMAMHADAKDLGIVLTKVPIGMDPGQGTH